MPLLIVSCATPECSIQAAIYDPIGLCQGPVVPDGLLEFAAEVREQGGIVVIGALRADAVGAAPRFLPDTCNEGVCLSESRMVGQVVVDDALGSTEVSEREEIVVTAPAGQYPTFTSDERGVPQCGVPRDWFPASRAVTCYTPANLLMPPAGDEYALFLSPQTEDGSRDLLWTTQTIGAFVVGDPVGRDVRRSELTLP